MLQNSMYHSFLRVSILVSAVVLVFVSGFIDDSTAKLSQGTTSYLANAVGASASVQPTELNQYTAELTKKQRDLDLRETALAEREIAVDISDGSISGQNTATYVLSAVLFILLVLIVLNYALDYLRIKEERNLFVPLAIRRAGQG